MFVGGFDDILGEHYLVVQQIWQSHDGTMSVYIVQLGTVNICGKSRP